MGRDERGAVGLTPNPTSVYPSPQRDIGRYGEGVRKYEAGGGLDGLTSKKFRVAATKEDVSK